MSQTPDIEEMKSAKSESLVGAGIFRKALTKIAAKSKKHI